MENEEPLKKKRRKKKKRKKDMGNLFFNITQLAILCIFLGVCFIIFQTGYIQKIFQLHQEAQQIMKTSTAADFQTDQQGEVYDKDGNLIPVPVKEGDRVLYGKFGGTEVNIEGEDVLIMRADDLYGVYTA